MSNESKFDNSGEDRPSTLGGTLSETASQVKNKVSELGRTAADTIDEGRETAAGGLDKAATTIHENASSLPGGQKVAELAHATAEKLNSTAGYMRSHDLKKMMDDVEILVKNNPGPSLAAAAVVGFLFARAFTRND